jgi:hypothetical protein
MSLYIKPAQRKNGALDPKSYLLAFLFFYEED